MFMLIFVCVVKFCFTFELRLELHPSTLAYYYKCLLCNYTEL